MLSTSLVFKLKFQPNAFLNSFKTSIGNLYPASRSYSTAVENSISENLENVLKSIREGNKRTLSKTITLVESTRIEDKEISNQLISSILHQRSLKTTACNHKNPSRSFRIGISGPPGTGKSTLIDSFGIYLIQKGYKIAVLAVDPSSIITGGSILGDKTRMTKLCTEPNAYIRPSPSRGTLGGVTTSASETILLLEEAGYDIILVETVGVGQSEIAVENVVDMFALLSNPAAGDELQGIKKGIVEIADIILVTKADGDLIPKANMAKSEILSALKYSTPKNKSWRTPVFTCSAFDPSTLVDVWDSMHEFWNKMAVTGRLEQKRQSQRKAWMYRILEEHLYKQLVVNKQVKIIAESVLQGKIAPTQAAQDLIKSVFLPHDTSL